MGMVRFVSVCRSQIYKNYWNQITQSSENRFLRILEFVIEVKNRNNERIWVHPSDMGIVGVVFLRWIWIYKKIWNPPTQSWENRILVNSIVHNQVLHCFFSLKTERTSQAISRKSDGQEQSVYDYDFVPTEYEAKQIFLKIGHFSWFVEGVKIGGSEVKKIFFNFCLNASTGS